MNLPTITKTDCQQCGIYSDICPMNIILLEDNGFQHIQEEDTQRCILCGHCEAICTTQLLKNNRLLKLQMIQQEITSKNLSAYFRSRRFIRKFSASPGHCRTKRIARSALCPDDRIPQIQLFKNPVSK